MATKKIDPKTIQPDKNLPSLILPKRLRRVYACAAMATNRETLVNSIYAFRVVAVSMYEAEGIGAAYTRSKIFKGKDYDVPIVHVNSMEPLTAREVYRLEQNTDGFLDYRMDSDEPEDDSPNDGEPEV